MGTIAISKRHLARDSYYWAQPATSLRYWILSSPSQDLLGDSEGRRSRFLFALISVGTLIHRDETGRAWERGAQAMSRRNQYRAEFHVPGRSALRSAPR